MLNIAMLSKWHVHADNYAQFIQAQPDAQITCVWDEDAARGAAWGEQLNVPFVPDLDALLARSDVDAVIIDSPTSMHKELMVRAARAGKHIFTEKCMCLTTADCDEVSRAVKDAGVIFTISFPQRTRGKNLLIKKLVEDGVIGDVTMLRARTSHNGATAGWLPDYWFDPETTGGGAMMDLGAHPMYLARWLLGRPVRVSSVFTARTGYAVEDNAVCAIEFENKAIAVTETSLISGLNPESLELYGTKGVILSVDDSLKIRTADSDRYVQGGWVDLKPLPDQPLPLRQFLDSVLYGKPVQFGLKEGRELTELMETAYIAHRERREAAFPTAYGLQLFSVRDSLKQDYHATLQAVAALGYKQVETIRLENVTAAQVRAWCDALGLTVCGTHTGAGALTPDNIEATIADHKALGCSLLIIPSHDLSTAQKIDEFVALVNRVQPILEEKGITLAFHNHTVEFAPNADGQIPFEEILARTEMRMELDICLAYQGGQDSAGLMERLGSRLCAIHLKDGDSADHGYPLGMGTAPVKACWEKAREMGVPIVVESESLTPDGLTEARICMDYLKTLERENR